MWGFMESEDSSLQRAEVPAQQDAERGRVLALLKRHGWNATSFQVLEPHFAYWCDADDADDAVVAYFDTGGAWVAAGPPVCPLERLSEVTARFVAAARASGRRASFFATEERFNTATGYPSLLIGEQPVWNPQRWPDALKASKSLREQLRRARARSVVVRRVGPAEPEGPEAHVRHSIETLIRKWLGSRQLAPMGFLVHVEPFAFSAERRYFVAELEGVPVAFLAAVPVYARGGWLFEDLVRDRNAPNGTAELLIDAAMRTVADEGSEWVTLGLVPLSGRIRGFLRLARRGAAPLYDFEGLRAFRTRLRPASWEPLYLSFPPGGRGPVALFDALAAFARGGFIRFGLETLSRGPSLVIQLLAVMLVPWTALLAAADTDVWFPAPWVKWGWVSFDVMLAVALFALAQRWRHWLATMIAVLVTTDAALTLVEAIVFNVPRARTALDWVALGIATCAPAVAAALVWSGRAHRARQSDQHAVL